jgi:hypothetical protein
MGLSRMDNPETKAHLAQDRKGIKQNKGTTQKSNKNEQQLPSNTLGVNLGARDG